MIGRGRRYPLVRHVTEDEIRSRPVSVSATCRAVGTCLARPTIRAIHNPGWRGIRGAHATYPGLRCQNAFGVLIDATFARFYRDLCRTTRTLGRGTQPQYLFSPEGTMETRGMDCRRPFARSDRTVGPRIPRLKPGANRLGPFGTPTTVQKCSKLHMAISFDDGRFCAGQPPLSALCFPLPSILLPPSTFLAPGTAGAIGVASKYRLLCRGSPFSGRGRLAGGQTDRSLLGFGFRLGQHLSFRQRPQAGCNEIQT